MVFFYFIIFMVRLKKMGKNTPAGKATKKKKSKITVRETKKKVEKKAMVAKKTVKKSGTKKTPPRLSKRERIIQEIKQNLISQREALLREAEEALTNLPGEINFPDMGDQATAETDRNFMLRLRDRERMLLKKIDETIERIDNNSYGICSSCGNEIDIKRLQVRPVTDLCIDCKIRQEEEEKIMEG